MGAGIKPTLKYDNPLETDGFVGLKELSIDADYEIGYGRLFVRSSDGKPYFVASDGTIYPLLGNLELTSTLLNNSSGSIIIMDDAVYMGAILEYTIRRGTLVSQGILQMVHNGTTVKVLHEWHGDDVKVTFDGSISVGEVLLDYVVDASGNDCYMDYLIKYQKSV